MTKPNIAVPVADPRHDLKHIRAEVLDAVARVVDAGHYILGKEVAEFENAISARVGAAGAVGVASGTDALVLALLAAGVSVGDEVITVSHTAGPTVAAICMTGAVPVLVDIEPIAYCLDPNRLESAVSARTKAIVPVHLYGHPADLKTINAFAQQRGIFVIEDCAQAQEATINDRFVGSIGDLGCFSFYPTKNLGALGDGGLITAAKSDVIDRVRCLRAYGWTRPQYAEISGGRCSRLDELQAAILNIKLKYLTGEIERRRQIAGLYNEALADLPLVRPTERPGCKHAYHLYVIRTDRRNALADHLSKAGIATGVHYPYPVHEQPGFLSQSRLVQPLSVTESVATELLTLPLYPHMPKDSCMRVIESVRGFFGKA
jgi:dTDP-3-amino-3,4,6-trideoxy-alpha-D-glucose transaminase